MPSENKLQNWVASRGEFPLRIGHLCAEPEVAKWSGLLGAIYTLNM